MSERSWLLRAAVRRILADAPLPPATWTSVIRRSAVVVACFLVGWAVGDLSAGVLAAFGALQASLFEAVLPLGRLVRLLLLVLIGCACTVFLGLFIGGTWWAVIVLALVAYAFGATAGLSPAAMTVGLSALAVGVIFAGMPVDSGALAAERAGIVTCGVAVQALAWVAAWRPERRRFVRHALANVLRTDVRMLHAPAVEVASLVKSHAQLEAAQAALDSAGFTAEVDHRHRAVLSRAVVVTRSITAWLVIDAPSEHDRIEVGLRLQAQLRRLEHRRTSAAASASHAPADSLARAESPAPSRAALALDAAICELEQAITDLLLGTDGLTGDLVISVRPQAAPPPVHLAAVGRALWPGRISRHGLRMALGIGIAEALTVAAPFAHSFWLPLTVVFTLRSDWSFTLIRGLTRTMGNLIAVIVLPALLIAVGENLVAIAVALFLLSAITFRTMFGNYSIASFGLAGAVLLLDYTLDPSESLFVLRIAAAVAGALLSLAVVVAVPNWSSADATVQVQTLVGILTSWRAAIRQRLTSGSLDLVTIERCLATARHALVALDQTSTGTLLEPRRGERGTRLAMITASGIAEFAALAAITTVVMTDDQSGPGSDVPVSDAPVSDVVAQARLDEASTAFDAAVTAWQESVSRPA